MALDKEIMAIEERLLTQLHAKLRVKSRRLPKAMKRAGRRLPRSAHKAAAQLEEARQFAGHPKLMQQIDPASLNKAEATIQTHLDKIDPKERRKDAMISLAASLALAVLGTIVLVVGLMYWRGLL